MNTGVFQSDGFMVGSPGEGNYVTSAGAPKAKASSTYVIGGGAGFQGGLFITNANSVGDLAGPSDTWNLSASPFIMAGIPAEFSISFSWSWAPGARWPTMTLSVGVGPGVIGSFSNYPTNTKVLYDSTAPKPKSHFPVGGSGACRRA
ncbi:MAG: hypothetical protein IPI73_24370 [Betaproteobacteria bacterium]|nr:hypothetical protein [Betaproteobacteria bacterium]